MARIFLLLVLQILAQTIALCQNRYVLPCSKALVVESRKVVWMQLGVTEATNRNDGKDIEKYLKVLGLPTGSPYCLAGQYYCFFEATKILGLPQSAIPLPSTGLSTGLFRFAKQKGKRQSKISIDDLIVWQRGRSIFGHTERIVKLGRKGWVETIGFNTRKFSKQENRWVEGVFLWKRNLIHPLGQLNLLGFVGFGE